MSIHMRTRRGFFIIVAVVSGWVGAAGGCCHHPSHDSHTSSATNGRPTGATREAAAKTMSDKSIQKSDFGKTPDGEAVDLYTLTNANGLVAKLSTYGAILTELHVPDRQGKSADVVLGFDNLGQYLAGHPFFGATVGRYANRIAGGKFTLDGKTYTLATNNGPNSLHGGNKGFDKRVWKAEPTPGADGPAIAFTYVSSDGEEGYPGTVDVKVTYTLTNKNELRIDYRAATDKATPVNLTNHSYFNLVGVSDAAQSAPAHADDSFNVLGHVVKIDADRYLPADATLIPTGELKPVKGTPLDFTTPTAIGARIDQVHGGYDHCFVIDGTPGELRPTARVVEPKSGRVMEMMTTEPGVQLYTSNFLDGKTKGFGGVAYGKQAALCLEAQHYPDSPNQPEFPSTILQPGKTYTQTTVYRFSTE